MHTYDHIWLKVINPTQFVSRHSKSSLPSGAEVAMLLYWALLLDLTIFSMQISVGMPSDAGTGAGKMVMCLEIFMCYIIVH